MPKWRMGKLNEGNVENKGESARNKMGMWVQKISIRIRGIMVEMQKMWRIRMAMHGIKVET